MAHVRTAQHSLGRQHQSTVGLVTSSQAAWPAEGWYRAEVDARAGRAGCSDSLGRPARHQGLARNELPLAAKVLSVPASARP
jgi:hypothetical protein